MKQNKLNLCCSEKFVAEEFEEFSTVMDTFLRTENVGSWKALGMIYLGRGTSCRSKFTQISEGVHS